jgi:hypothetical protein
MKRFAPLALIVLALALVPAALADDTTPPAQQPAAPAATQTPAQAGGHANVRLRLEILRLRVQLVRLRFRLHCGPNGNASQDQCVAFAQKVEARLTTFDANVQKKIADLQACTSDSTDPKCKNADKKIALLTKIDQRVQTAIQNIQKWIDGNGSGTAPTSSSSDSSLDQAASNLSQAASGANG